MRNLITIFTLLLTLSSFAQRTGASLDRTVAIVGDRTILKSDVEVQIERLRDGTSAIPEDIRCEILYELISQKVLQNQAELDSIVVNDKEVDAELDQRVNSFIGMLGSIEALEKYYKKSVVEIKEEFRPDIKEQLLAKKMRDNIIGDMKITPSEVTSFYHKIPKSELEYYNDQVEIGQIIMDAKPSLIAKQYARKKAEEIRKKLIDGSDFCASVLLYSDDPGSKQNCGKYPEFGRDAAYAKEFKAASFKLKKNEISEVTQTQFGYHIIRLIDRKGERVTVQHILIQPQVLNSDVQLAQKKLDSLRTAIINGKLKFGSAVAEFSDDQLSKRYNGRIVNPQTGDLLIDVAVLGQMDNSIAFKLETMKPGDISKPELVDNQGKKAVRVLYLIREIAPHVESLEQDFPRIKEKALSVKKEKALDDWIIKNSPNTYIRVDKVYSDCEKLNKWIKNPK